MFRNIYIKDVFDGFFDGLYPWIAKLNNFSVTQDQMVVLLVEIRLFVMRLILAKLVLAHQPAV